MIQNVEYLYAKLHLATLAQTRHWCILHEGYIRVGKTGPSHDVLPHGSDEAEGREGKRAGLNQRTAFPTGVPAGIALEPGSATN